MLRAFNRWVRVRLGSFQTPEVILRRTRRSALGEVTIQCGGTLGTRLAVPPVGVFHRVFTGFSQDHCRT
jgi:hypothetical protein